ncbi:hypothetical protein [Piscinibacter gummiphilus]|uniref:Uncharacterized protein n=1 Tax=Piscinibacter gummiphilus TaxID=946333 RepID=A0ABZ0D2B9_9BURK|nr:hypothetical protein [Piscinibacter gummiphilus]WOB11329.1 hypothetical protein RXV79_28010 [Piscinibacter gummiphilus]
MEQLSFAELLIQAPYADKINAIASDEYAQAASYAYNRLLTYKAAAAKQLERMQEAKAVSARYIVANEPRAADGWLAMKNFVEGYRDAAASLIYETHFYFIAWHNCSEMLETLTKDPAFREARKAYTKNAKMWHHYKAARHSFEHFADRLPGGSEHERKMVEVTPPGGSPLKIFFGFVGDNYEHSDQVWDIGQASLDNLYGAIDAVLSALYPIVDKLVAEKFPRGAKEL